jgi:hypothetical protein
MIKGVIIMEKQVDKHKLSFPVTFEKINEIKNGDTRFTKLRCWLMHTGENYNNSDFSREVIEEAIPSLAYIPVVGFIEDNNLGEKDFSDHRYIITKDNGKIRRKYMGSAYGVILNSEDNNAHFETKICDDGIEREFIVADAIAWNFLEDSSQILNRDLIKDHSIELDEDSVEGYEDEETGIFHFTKFSFRAACVLGGSAQPAMEGSTVEVVNFTITDFVKNLQSELINKYNTFTELVNKENNNGGIENMAKTDFTQTVLNQFQDIASVVNAQETFKDKWGDDVPRYYATDVQENEVIVVDRMNNYNYYGVSFTIDGDKPVLDFTNCKRKKVVYENYEENTTVPEGSFNFGKHIADIEEVAFAKVNEAMEKIVDIEQAKTDAETNYSQIKADYDEIKPKYDEYVQAEEKRQADELNAQKDSKFAEYEDILSENADFTALKERKDELSVDEIEKECAVLYVKANRSKANFSKSNSTSAIVGVINDEDDNDDGDYAVTKYGNIPISR